VPYASAHALEEEGLGFDVSGIIGAVGGGISNAFNVAGQIEGRRAGHRLLSEGRSSMWSERLAEAQHRGELADLEAQLRQEEQQLLSEMEVEARQERLAAIRARQREVVALRRAQTEEERRRAMRRLPSWVWPVLGVGLIGGTFAFVVWRAGRP
jgi:nitrate reductase NapE component